MKKFYFVSYTEWNGNGYETITKIFASLPEMAKLAIAKEEDWDGLHWTHPSVIFSETVNGFSMSEQAQTIVRALNAEEDIDDGEEDEEVYTPSPLQQWLINKKS